MTAFSNRPHLPDSIWISVIMLVHFLVMIWSIHIPTLYLKALLSLKRTHTHTQQGCKVPKNKKRPKLAISSFKTAEFSNVKKGQIKANFPRKFYFVLPRNPVSFVEILPKSILFLLISKKVKNSQIVKSFYVWQTISKRPNGNPDTHTHIFYSPSLFLPYSICRHLSNKVDG